MATTNCVDTNDTRAEQMPIDSTPLLDLDQQLRITELCARINDRVQKFLTEKSDNERIQSAQEQTRTSLGAIEEALRRYKLSELSISYNGGKDCLVLLILYLCALHNHPELLEENAKPVQSVYIQSKHPFHEVEDFVKTSSRSCSLALTRYDMSMKQAFAEYLREFPKVKAIFVGTRRTDPHGANLTFFDRTDHGWPDFMRIHPVVDWHYVDVWTFIRHLNIPYCPLYDQGYTSLGGTTDTNKNPALRRQSVAESGRPEIIFRPAYELVEDEEERLGREKIKSAHPTPSHQKPPALEGDLDTTVAIGENA